MQACFNSKGEKGPEQSTTGFQKGIFLAIKKKKKYKKPPKTTTNNDSKKRKMNSENQRWRKGFMFFLSLKQLYLSKREVKEVGTELLMNTWADKKEVIYLGAMSIPVRSKSAADW